MNRYVVILLLALLSVSTQAATPAGPTKSPARQHALAEQSSQYVVRFALEGSKAELFTKIYQEYNKTLKEVMRTHPATHVAEPTEEQLEAEILARFERQLAILNVRQQYYHQLRQVLSPSQIQQIYEDEKARRDQITKQ